LKPPEYFTDEQRSLWEKLLVKVTGNPLATDLEAYCVEFSRWREAEEWLKANGTEILIRDDKGTVKNVITSPQLRIARDAMSAVQKLSKVLRIKGEL